jgi:hypothetical protein
MDLSIFLAIVAAYYPQLSRSDNEDLEISSCGENRHRGKELPPL